MVAPGRPVDNPSTPTAPAPALAPHEPVEPVVRRLIAADPAAADNHAVAVGGPDVAHLVALRPGAVVARRSSLSAEPEVPTVLVRRPAASKTRPPPPPRLPTGGSSAAASARGPTSRAQRAEAGRRGSSGGHTRAGAPRALRRDRRRSCSSQRNLECRSADS
ncbi:hypothetical protein DL768_009476 [Monosporascus sp. mg162]|nr:hypothetical protein DL768_009476 [Monosporascus sp. mg162]